MGYVCNAYAMCVMYDCGMHGGIYAMVWHPFKWNYYVVAMVTQTQIDKLCNST